MCMIDGCDGWTFGRTEDRKARKSHKCDECRREILPGERYRYLCQLFEGDFSDSKMCAHCIVAGDWLQKNCGGYVTHAVQEDIAEHVDEYRGVYKHTVRPLQVIALGMRRGWKIKRGPRAGQLRPIPRMPPVVEELH